MRKQYIKLLEFEREKMNEIKNSTTIHHEELKQIKALLMFDEGNKIVETAEKLGVSFQTLKKWRKNFEDNRLESIPFFKVDLIDEIIEDENEDEEDDENKNEIIDKV